MTHWFERTAGEGPALGQPHTDILPEEPTVLLLHNGIPDWIRDPLTGAQVEVHGTVSNPAVCPSCAKELPRALALVTARDGHPEQQLVVIECPHEKKYVFATRPRSP